MFGRWAILELPRQTTQSAVEVLMRRDDCQLCLTRHNFWGQGQQGHQPQRPTRASKVLGVSTWTSSYWCKYACYFCLQEPATCQSCACHSKRARVLDCIPQALQTTFQAHSSVCLNLLAPLRQHIFLLLCCTCFCCAAHTFVVLHSYQCVQV